MGEWYIVQSAKAWGARPCQSLGTAHLDVEMNISGFSFPRF